MTPALAPAHTRAPDRRPAARLLRTSRERPRRRRRVLASPGRCGSRQLHEPRAPMLSSARGPSPPLAARLTSHHARLEVARNTSRVAPPSSGWRFEAVESSARPTTSTGAVRSSGGESGLALSAVCKASSREAPWRVREGDLDAAVPGAA